jgi:hypothetical protein
LNFYDVVLCAFLSTPSILSQERSELWHFMPVQLSHSDDDNDDNEVDNSFNYDSNDGDGGEDGETREVQAQVVMLNNKGLGPTAAKVGAHTCEFVSF